MTVEHSHPLFKKQTQQEGISQFITMPYFGHPSIAFAHKLRQSFRGTINESFLIFIE